MSMNLDGFVKKKTKMAIGTKEFIFTELSIGDLCAFQAEMQRKREVFNVQRRERIIEDSKRVGGVDPLELLKFVDKPLTAEEVDAEMETFDGLCYLAYLSLKYANPEVTTDDVKSIITPSLSEAITGAMFPPVDDDKKDAEKKTPVLIKKKKTTAQQ